MWCTNLCAVEEAREARREVQPEATRMRENSTSGCRTTPAAHLNGQFRRTHFPREHLLQDL